MKKITLMAIALVFSLGAFAQSTCTDTFSVSGSDDDPTVLTINAADVTCNGADAATSMQFVNAAGSLTSTNCSTNTGTEWFAFELAVTGGVNDGLITTVCANELNGLDLTGFTSLTITSSDSDAWSDAITIEIDVEVTFTASVAPNCDAVLTTPTDGAVDVDESTNLTWAAATGGPSGYFLSVGTTTGGTDVVNNLDVGNVTSYDLPSLMYSQQYFVNITPYNANGSATGCTEESFTTEAMPAPGEDCGTAVTMTVETDCSAATPYTIDYSTAVDIGSVPSCDQSGVNTGAWFEFTTTATGAVTLNMSDSNEYAVFDSCGGSEVVCSATATTSVEITLMPSTTYKLVVWKDSATTGTSDICIEEYTPPTCPDPTGANASGITLTSAMLGWTEEGSSANWDIEWGVDGFTPTGTPNIDDTADNPHELTGLTESTAYDFYVRSDCGMDNTSDVSNWVGPISFTTVTPPPANDDFADAIAVTCGGNYTGSTALATLDEDDAPDSASPNVDLDAPNVWYSYTGSGSPEDVTLNLCPSDYDSSVLVYTGTSGNLTLVAANDDGGTANCTIGSRSFLTFQSDGTTTYYITIEGWNVGSTGNYDMTVSCVPQAPPPANDLCANAEMLTLTVPTSGTTVGATGEIGDDNPSCESTFATIVDVWYSVEITGGTSDLNILTTVTGTSDQANVAVYSDCTLATQLGCSDANGGENLTVPGLAAGTYIIRVWGDGVAARGEARIEGTFDIVADATLSTGSFENEAAFTYYPNPVQNTLTLNAQNTIENVTMYNMLGQEVLKATPNAVNSELNMSNLQDGAYFVKVTIANVTKTIKVIKQ